MYSSDLNVDCVGAFTHVAILPGRGASGTSHCMLKPPPAQIGPPLPTYVGILLRVIHQCRETKFDRTRWGAYTLRRTEEIVIEDFRNIPLLGGLCQLDILAP